MDTTIVIKGYANGIRMILPADMEFSELLTKLKDKLLSSAKFFQGGRVALDIEGRSLSEEEEKAIIYLLEEEAGISIVCILGKDDKNEKYLKAVKKIVPPSQDDRDILFHHGNLQDGDHLRSDKTIFLFGNAYPGSTIHSDKDIYVFGTLEGIANAGSEENSAKVSAFCLTPQCLIISGHSADADILKQFTKRKYADRPMTAYYDDAKKRFGMTELKKQDLMG